jgi:hypothetical protein
MTNDSTIQVPGITERGVYYVDLYGNGKADVYADNADFGVALIGGTGPDLVHRVVRLKNTLNGPIVITKVFFDGADISEFTRDGSWTNVPLVLNGGQEVNFGVVFGPVAGGQPGPRVAALKLITANGDTIVARLTGIAGTREIAVSPTTVNFGTVTSGKMLRRTITITSTGTMPLMLQVPQMSPGSDFTAGSLPRLVLAPGQTEYLELTYAPQTSGGSNAIMTILSNGTNGTGGSVQVTLTGTALKTKLIGIDPSQTVAGPVRGGLDLPGNVELSASGVAGEDAMKGVSLWQSVPNPAREQAEIRYSLDRTMDVRLELYDASGRLVRVMETGNRETGSHSVILDVRGLASGIYHYRLSTPAGALTRSIDVVR